jgi:transcriptional regulator with XRE-family HTH domain
MAHPHGTSRRYRHGPDEHDVEGRGCHCTRCTAAATRDMKVRRLTGPRLVNAEPVREHLCRLKAAGLPYASAASIAAVPYMVVSRLLYGDSRGNPPSRRMRRAYAKALLAVRPEQVGGQGRVLADGTRRRLQALARSGWPMRRVAAAAGMSAEYLSKIARQECGPTVTADTARRIAAAYDRMWASDPVAAEVPKAAMVRTMAIKRGWLGALAWDDGLIDLVGDDLEAELRRRVRLMDDEEIAACHYARRRQGDQSPLMVAAAREYDRRRVREHRKKSAA